MHDDSMSLKVYPYILTFAHSCSDLVVISHVPAKSMKSEWVNDLAAEQFVNVPRNEWIDVWVVHACQHAR